MTSTSSLLKQPASTLRISRISNVKAPSQNTYWECRKDAIYLFAAKQICRRFAKEPRSVIDIGSNRTPTLEWHRASGVRLASLDLRQPYKGAGVDSIREDFLLWQCKEPFDLVTCFQTLEHIAAAGDFAQKLLATGHIIVVSVPYKWAEGKCAWHIHDPVDEKKMLAWFGKKPKFSYVARELNGTERLIHVYRGGPRSSATKQKSRRKHLRKAWRLAQKFFVSNGLKREQSS
jgi:hypothetical protein